MTHVYQRFPTFAKAILYGEDNDIFEYLELGAIIDEVDEFGFTPLIEAILTDKPHIVKAFVERGCVIDYPDVCGRTPLFWAADHNDLSLCEFLLKQGADPNSYTIASQPLLVNPILRNQTALKNLLIKYGALRCFADDYINTKLIGHRYELTGEVTLYNHNKAFIPLDFEGFFLEFTVAIIRDSLERFVNHFGGRKLKYLFRHCEVVIQALSIAAELLQYQHHMVKLDRVAERIRQLIQFQPLLIPVGYCGHAVTFILFKNVFVKIDRGHLSHQEGSVVIYQISKPEMASAEFITHLLYTPQPKEFVEQTFKDILGLAAVIKIPITSQKVGNCSWANVEAVVPTMIFLSMWAEQAEVNDESLQNMLSESMKFFNQWSEWDKDITLSDCIRSFREAKDVYRQATKVDLLAAILFHSCDYRNNKDLKRAEKILPIVTQAKFDYVLKSYLSVYLNQERRDEGHNLMHIMELCGASFDDWLASVQPGNYGDSAK